MDDNNTASTSGKGKERATSIDESKSGPSPQDSTMDDTVTKVLNSLARIFDAVAKELLAEEDEGNSPSPPPVSGNAKDGHIPQPSEQFKATFFGLKRWLMSGKQTEKQFTQPLAMPGAYNNADYEEKYPPDPRHEELSENARVWWMYNDEAAIFDAEMVGEASDSLDILLVFAGLFSAVLTTFVAQTSQSLSPDNSAIAVSLLVELVSVQRAMATGESVRNIAHADIAPSIARSDVWVNGLWFTSLTLSLSSALFAVLSKQWLRQYTSFISGSARDRALIRQFRYDGMEKWAVRTIIGLLPTVLHLALGLFLLGLVVFLSPLQKALSIVVGILSGISFTLYLSSIVIAVISVQSPYRTTSSDIISNTIRWALSDDNNDMAANVRLAERHAAAPTYIGRMDLAVRLCNTLSWVIITANNSSVKPLVFQSLGAFPAFFLKNSRDSYTYKLFAFGVTFDYKDSEFDKYRQQSSNPSYHDRLERYWRSTSCIRRGWMEKISVKNLGPDTDPELLAFVGLKDLPEFNVPDSEKSTLSGLIACGFDAKFAAFIICKCQHLTRPDNFASNNADPILGKIPWFSESTWLYIVCRRRAFKFMTPDELRNYDNNFNKKAYIDILYHWEVFVAHDKLEIGQPNSLWGFMHNLRTSFSIEPLRGWPDTHKHPLIQEICPGYKLGWIRV
ncbi:hypothetical protein CYLTODRAFT_494909 [Cylindrobasidium torrendii FP15055 ss-10]|uniref:DUF6535 domain-containing protein n=1 Tax=Cylindrobasidium torrendii FP15055 ss-10 TaxID=1314674 RepID=A0A0D7AXN8_9AGAR|nr:hypothetical protein CYLTODRAFT_494909 [Cylindrobasidium torrendii FP15055 ss-10]